MLSNKSKCAGVALAMPRRKYIASNTYGRGEERLQINDQTISKRQKKKSNLNLTHKSMRQKAVFNRGSTKPNIAL